MSVFWGALAGAGNVPPVQLKICARKGLELASVTRPWPRRYAESGRCKSRELRIKCPLPS